MSTLTAVASSDVPERNQVKSHTYLKSLCAGLLTSRVFHAAVILYILLQAFLHCLDFQIRATGSIGFAMDDAWIHVGMARNFIEGNGFAINPGHSLSVSTSPTWTLLVACFLLFFKDPIQATLTLSLLCMAVASLLCYSLTARLTERPLLGVVAAIITILNPIALWGLASGMEVPLAILVLMLVLWSYYAAEPDSNFRRYVVPICLAFAAVTRPELFMLIPFALLETFWKLARSGKPDAMKKALTTGVIQGALVLACLTPYFVFNKSTSGLLFPTTYYAKTKVRGVGLSAAIAAREPRYVQRALINEPVAQVFDVAETLLRHNLVMLLLAAAGYFAFLKGCSLTACSRGVLLPAALFVLPYIMGISTPARYLSNHADRYYAIFPPMAAVLSCVAIALVLTYARQRMLATLCAILMLIAPSRTTYKAIQLQALGVGTTNLLYVEMGKWIHENLPKDAVLAVNDIGGLAYWGQRQVIDVMGLASPEIWPAIQRAPGGKLDLNRLRAYLRDAGVTHVILSPKYYPDLTNDTKAFIPLHQWESNFDYGRPTITPQVLYEVHWDAS